MSTRCKNREDWPNGRNTKGLECVHSFRFALRCKWLHIFALHIEFIGEQIRFLLHSFYGAFDSTWYSPQISFVGFGHPKQPCFVVFKTLHSSLRHCLRLSDRRQTSAQAWCDGHRGRYVAPMRTGGWRNRVPTNGGGKCEVRGVRQVDAHQGIQNLFELPSFSDA